MKSIKDVDWITERSVTGVPIEFTYEFYSGATVYKYWAHYLLTDEKVIQTIYGVSKETGDLLIELWNTKQPDKWKYSILEPPILSINFHQVVPDSHFWTDINQMLEWLKYQGDVVSVSFLKEGLENTLKQGYNLKKEYDPKTDNTNNFN